MDAQLLTTNPSFGGKTGTNMLRHIVPYVDNCQHIEDHQLLLGRYFSTALPQQVLPSASKKFV